MKESSSRIITSTKENWPRRPFAAKPPQPSFKPTQQIGSMLALQEIYRNYKMEYQNQNFSSCRLGQMEKLQ